MRPIPQNRKQQGYFISFLVLVWLLSFYLHTPTKESVLRYTDIVYGVFIPRFLTQSHEYWMDNTSLILFTEGKKVCPLPYIDYMFEYPPVVGFLWALTTCIGFHVARENGHIDVWKAAQVHYIAQSLVILFFFVLTGIVSYKIAGRLSLDEKRVFLFALLPSTVMYLVYNWDIVAVALALSALYMYTRKAGFLAGTLLGLSISTKILTLGVGGWIIAEYITRREYRSALRFLAGIILGLTPFLVLFLVSPVGFKDFISYHAGWYCENCLYLPLLHDLWSSTPRILYPILVLATYSLLVASYVSRHISSTSTRLHALFTLQLAFVLFNYVFTPQMLILVSPFAVLALEGFWLILYIVVDALNAIITPLFIAELEDEGSPWFWGSQTQYVVALRNIILLVLFIYCITWNIRGKRD